MSITCDFCETKQPPASLCAVCGLALKLPPGVKPTADPPIVPLPGLESTSFDEALLFGDEERPEGFEATLLEPVPDERREPPSRAASRAGSGRSALHPLACPWCGLEDSGRICAGCGRAKSKVLADAPGEEAVEDERVRCRGCGGVVLTAARCSECAQPLS